MAKKVEANGQTGQENEDAGTKVHEIPEKTMAEQIQERMIQPSMPPMTIPQPQVVGVLTYTKVMMNGNPGMSMDMKGQFTIDDLLNISDSLRQAARSQTIAGTPIDVPKQPETKK